MNLGSAPIPPMQIHPISEDHTDVASDFAAEHVNPIVARMVMIDDDGPMRDHSATLAAKRIELLIAWDTPIYPRLSGTVYVADMPVNWHASLRIVSAHENGVLATYTLDQD